LRRRRDILADSSHRQVEGARIVGNSDLNGEKTGCCSMSMFNKLFLGTPEFTSSFFSLRLLYATATKTTAAANADELDIDDKIISLDLDEARRAACLSAWNILL
jgi:hypothetical protein